MKLSVACLLVIGAALSSPQAAAQSIGTAESASAKEILAFAPSRDGEGSITILRVYEGDTPAIGIRREGRIGKEYHPQPEWKRLPISEQVSLVFEDVSGRRLPGIAMEALRGFEAGRAIGADRYQSLSTKDHRAKDGDGKPPLCSNSWTHDNKYFLIDCLLKGPVSREASKPDDVCLLTAAIKGNHTQELSYKAINGKFYETHESNVYEGHWVAYQHLTDYFRTRKGHIFNAQSSDESRFEYSGNVIVEASFPEWKPQSDCQAVSN